MKEEGDSTAMKNNIDRQQGDTATDHGMASIIIETEDKITEFPMQVSALMKKGNDVVIDSAALGDRADTDEHDDLIENLLGNKTFDYEKKYDILQKVAEGGMGEVFFVYDKHIRRPSILKIMLPKHRDDEIAVRQFITEARITGELVHPNIISTLDLGFRSGTGIYFTMGYTHGQSLADIIAAIVRQDPEYTDKYDLFTLINIFRKVCEAVSYAHSKNIIHRDIKPSNIWVGKYGEVLLLDWGLAKKLGRSEMNSWPASPTDSGLDGSIAPDSTQRGVIKGSPAYMSPEQAFGDADDIDQLSDIFLLGATLYHMFTFDAPYVGFDIKDVVKKARRCDYIRPEDLWYRSNYQLSREVSRIIEKAMAPFKGNRYTAAVEIIRDLDNLVSGRMEFESEVFTKGEYLLKQGRRGEKSYLIVKGRVRVYSEAKGEKIILGTLEKGDIVGEMALITSEPRTANAVALEPTEALVLNKDIFSLNLHKLPYWMEKTIRALAERLGKMNLKLRETVISGK